MRSLDLERKMDYTCLIKITGGHYKMKEVTIKIPEYLFGFYEKVGEQAGGIAPEQVMSDALFKLAGELSLNAIHKKETS